jgi:hypothetical protein
MVGVKTREYWQTKIRKSLILHKPGPGITGPGLCMLTPNAKQIRSLKQDKSGQLYASWMT